MASKPNTKILRNVIIEQGNPGPEGDIILVKGCTTSKGFQGHISLFFSDELNDIIGTYTTPKVIDNKLVTNLKFYDWNHAYMPMRPVIGGQLIERDLFNPKLITKAIIRQVSLVMYAQDMTIPTIGDHIAIEEKIKQQTKNGK